ncbi:hypothetical protein BaOVIS_023190 [Babesia ovis]|uniref:Uncharacterized protein n=1 Tax=Babesia ovis TaxID=5869 RepID=A0A9W5WVC8_BABOV|nr:hypothetical protein BaOVIS_023190 [Babesia ovis]
MGGHTMIHTGTDDLSNKLRQHAVYLVEQCDILSCCGILYGMDKLKLCDDHMLGMYKSQVINTMGCATQAYPLVVLLKLYSNHGDGPVARLLLQELVKQFDDISPQGLVVVALAALRLQRETVHQEVELVPILLQTSKRLGDMDLKSLVQLYSGLSRSTRNSSTDGLLDDIAEVLIQKIDGLTLQQAAVVLSTVAIRWKGGSHNTNFVTDNHANSSSTSTSTNMGKHSISSSSTGNNPIIIGEMGASVDIHSTIATKTGPAHSATNGDRDITAGHANSHHLVRAIVKALENRTLSAKPQQMLYLLSALLRLELKQSRLVTQVAQEVMQVEELSVSDVANLVYLTGKWKLEQVSTKWLFVQVNRILEQAANRDDPQHNTDNGSLLREMATIAYGLVLLNQGSGKGHLDGTPYIQRCVNVAQDIINNTGNYDPKAIEMIQQAVNSIK